MFIEIIIKFSICFKIFIFSSVYKFKLIIIIISINYYKKSIKARTIGKAKRALKRSLIPGYGKKGMGWIKDSKRAAYNRLYHRTTISLSDFLN